MPFYSYTLLLFGKLFLPLCSFCLGAHPVDRAEADNEARGERAAPRCGHVGEPDHLEGGSFLFINTNCTDILDCDTNTETIAKAIKYLKTSVQMEL